MSPSGGPAGTIVNMAMVYDSAADRMVVFGGTDFQGHGSDTTWAYDFESNTWTDRNPETHPHAGWLDRAAYDIWAHRMMMFGGYHSVTERLRNETWAYDYETNTWTNMSQAIAPSPRYHGGFAYDSGVDRFVLYGGIGDDNSPFETWLYDYNNNTWSLIGPDHSPPPKALMGMAFDTQSARTIMFGGHAGANTPGNETWAFTAENKQQDDKAYGT